MSADTDVDLLTLIDTAPAWVTPARAARIAGIPVETIRTWAKRGQIPTMCMLTGQRLVHWPSCDTLANRDQRAISRATCYSPV